MTCLPANQMAVQHLRMAKMNAEELIKALPFEAAGKLPFDAGRAVLRHTISGEVYQNQEAKQEVILMAAPREAVDRHLSLLSKTGAGGGGDSRGADGADRMLRASVQTQG